MQRIKAINGYTIYKATERDEARYNVTADYFYLYFSSDIRDYGLAACDWDWEAGSEAEAIAWASGSNYAAARELVEAETTCATFEAIAEVEARLDAGESADDIADDLGGDEKQTEDKNIMRKKHYSKYFCGNEISKYGQDCGYLDYATLAKAFDAVLVNDITKLFYADINGEYCEAEQIQGFHEDDENDDGYYPEIYQYYIVSDQGAELLQEYTNDPLFYLPVIDVYVWGVTHYGTSWSYVLTDVKLELKKQ